MEFGHNWIKIQKIAAGRFSQELFQTIYHLQLTTIFAVVKLLVDHVLLSIMASLRMYYQATPAKIAYSITQHNRLLHFLSPIEHRPIHLITGAAVGNGTHAVF